MLSGAADAYLDSDLDIKSGEWASQPTHIQHVMFALHLSGAHAFP